MMDTKKIIKCKLNEEFETHKRLSMVKVIMDKSINHLFDSYREMDLAIQYCDNPLLREKLETVRRLLGNDNDLSGYIEVANPSIITLLQNISKEFKV